LVDVKLSDVIKAIVKDVASEIVGKDSVTQALSDVAKRLVGGFRTFQVTVKIESDGRVSIWVFAETP